MSKVIKIFLNKGYIPIDKGIFKIGSCIDFDCYIQRFNGYAIFIEAGTYIDEKLYNKITQKKLQIFVKNTQYEKYKDYVPQEVLIENSIESLILEDEIKKVLTVDKILSTSKSVENKLNSIYFCGKNLINSWLIEKNSKKLPINAFEVLSENLVEIICENRVTLSSFNDFIDGKYSLATHLLNVAFFTSLIGYQINLDLEEQKKLVISAMLHDIGKSEIDEALLDKPDMLSEEEFNIVKNHSLKSVSIVKKAGLKDKVIIDAIKHHHERLDGSGYPHALHAKLISQFGQILAVCDVFDALITIKPYRGAYSTYNALTLIGVEYKHKLNMKYVNIFIKLLK